MRPVLALAALVMALVGTGMVLAAPFESSALRGVTRIHVSVEGVRDDFERYGLTAARLREATEQRLRAHGIDVIAADSAAADPAAGRLLVKLITNQDPYGSYSYLISLRLQRKLPLDAGGNAFVAETVWSQGQNGVLNPSDLRRVYDYTAALVDSFLRDHARHNAGVPASREP